MIWLALGWTGQALFFLRFCIQWLASERAGRSVAPLGFWQMSLAGSLLVGVYTVAAQEPILAAGFLGNAWIYARNVALGRSRSPRTPRLAVEAAGIAMVLAAALAAGAAAIPTAERSPVWLAVAICGQLCWSSRFVVQWIASVRAGISHFPRSFWWTSLSGNLLLLAYTLHRGDPLLVCAFAFGPIVQIRNLMLGGAAPQAVPVPVPEAVTLHPR